MKQLVLCILLSSLIFSCNDAPTTADGFTRHPTDTVLTTILYANNWAYHDYRIVTAQKVILDTFAYASVDSLTQQKKWHRDSLYFIQLIDTVRGPKGIVRDSIGRPKLEMKALYLPQQIILKDFNKNWSGTQ